MKKILFLFIICTYFATPFLAANTHPPDSSDSNLKVLSWNIYMLPKFIKASGKKKRADAIINQLNNGDYDIIVFQEAFHHKVRKIIYSGLKESYPNQYGPANNNHTSFIKFNSGIWVISKVPLKQLNEIEFKNCKGIDCRARKGALMLEGEWNGKPFQLIGTHLNSAGDNSVRKGQYKEILSRLVNPFQKKGVPQIICGDFNVDAYQKENYLELINALNVAESKPLNEFSYHPKKNDMVSNTTTEPRLIDFIFLRNTGSKSSVLKNHIKVFTHPWKKNKKDLSDHYAIEAVVSLK